MLLASERGGRNEYAKANELLQRASAAARQAGNDALMMRAECTLAFNESDQGLEDAARAGSQTPPRHSCRPRGRAGHWSSMC